MDIHTQAGRGAKAQGFLNDELLKEMLESADRTFVEEWRRADTPAKREAAHAKQAALAGLKLEFQRVIDGGAMAEAKIAEQKRREDAASRGARR